MSIIFIIIIIIACFFIYVYYYVPTKVDPPDTNIIKPVNNIEALYNKGVDDISTLGDSVKTIDNSSTEQEILFRLSEEKILNKNEGLVNDLTSKYLSNSLIIAVLNTDIGITINEPIIIAQWKEFMLDFMDFSEDKKCVLAYNEASSNECEVSWKLELIPISVASNKISSLQLQYTYTYNNSSNTDIPLKHIVLKSNTISIDSKFKYISIAYCNSNDINLLNTNLQNSDGEKIPMKILFNFTINKVNLYNEMNIINVNNQAINKKFSDFYPNFIINFFWQRRSYFFYKKPFTLAYNGTKSTQYFYFNTEGKKEQETIGNLITMYWSPQNDEGNDIYPSLSNSKDVLMGLIDFNKDSKLKLGYVKYVNGLLSQKGINSVMDMFEA